MATWSSTYKAVGRLVALGLLVYFLSRVFMAVGKLQNAKMGLSVTKHFEKSRLMPSFSICFRNKKEHYGYDRSDVELGLNISRNITFKQLFVLKAQ